MAKTICRIPVVLVTELTDEYEITPEIWERENHELSYDRMLAAADKLKQQLRQAGFVVDDDKDYGGIAVVMNEQETEMMHAHWAKEHEEAEQQYEKLNKLSEDLGVKYAIYSLRERPDDVLTESNRADIRYDGGWGEGAIYKIIKDKGPITYADVLVAADALIQASGDTHHVFLEGVERFVTDDDDVETFNIWFGS